METELKSKADQLVSWVIGNVQDSTSVLAETTSKGHFDFSDQKMNLTKEVLGRVGYEFLLFSFHLADLYVYKMLGAENRGQFQNYVVEKVLLGLEIEMDDNFIDIYNSRLQEYSKYKTLMADTEKGESPKGTLFWEFGKRISSLISATPDHIIIITAVSGMAARAWMSLWSLKLLHSR